MEKTINELVIELIEFIKEPSYVAVMLCGNNIRVIANKCKKSPLFELSPEKKQAYIKDFEGDNKKKIVDIYKDFLIKCAEAPTTLHAKGCAILLLPILDELITNEKH